MTQNNITEVSPFIQDIVEKVFGDHLEIWMITINPETGKLVKVVDGQYWGTFGFSNFWYWKDVKVDNSLDDEIHCGYGWTPLPEPEKEQI